MELDAKFNRREAKFNRRDAEFNTTGYVIKKDQMRFTGYP